MPRTSPEFPLALGRAAREAATQHGVCTSQQAQACGLHPRAIGRLVESGRWLALHKGVYLVSPGPADLPARLMAAHLALGPQSVVAGRWALRYWGLTDTDPPGPIEMLVPEQSRRSVRDVRCRRVPGPLERAHPVRRPPVLTVEHTVLSAVAGAVTEAEAVDVVLRACRARMTTPDRLLETAATLKRLHRRTLLRTLCAEAHAGVTSPLEREYRRRVCRAHGLPVGRGQALALGVGGRRMYRDIQYDDHHVIVELDGRLGHETESEVLRDQFRDNQAALSGEATLRFGWLAVVGQSCSVAAQVQLMLRKRGWTGTGKPCGPDCAAAEQGRPRAPPRLRDGRRFHGHRPTRPPVRTRVPSDSRIAQQPVGAHLQASLLTAPLTTAPIDHQQRPTSADQRPTTGARHVRRPRAHDRRPPRQPPRPPDDGHGTKALPARDSSARNVDSARLDCQLGGSASNTSREEAAADGQCACGDPVPRW